MPHPSMLERGRTQSRGGRGRVGNESMTSFDDEAIVEDEDEEVKGAFQRSVTAARGRVSGEGHHFGYSGFACQEAVKGPFRSASFCFL